MTQENFIRRTIENLENYLHYEMWRHMEPPFGREECELFLKLLTQQKDDTVKEIPKNAESEKERIIKELQSKELGNLIKKNRRDGFGERELDQGMPEYHYREGLSEGILIAIEIVKRGGTWNDNPERNS